MHIDNYIIIHGSFGSKDGNWFPWLKEQLEGKDKKVEVPQMPVGVGKQNFESWSNVLDKLTINENTIIIAHSIAPIFVCKYLIINKITVKKLIFVCGFNNYLGIDNDFDAVNEPMFIDNFENVKNIVTILFVIILTMIHMLNLILKNHLQTKLLIDSIL